MMIYHRLSCAAAVLLQLTMISGVVVLRLAAAGGDGGGTTHHVRVFMHDEQTGPSPTAVVVVNGTAPVIPGVARFGDVVVIDNPLTAGPGRASRPVGRAQGTYVTTSLPRGRPAVLVSASVVLADYPGSTVAVMGRNEVTAAVRELAVVGGTGRFRMATGYVLWKTVSWSAANKSAILELDIFLRA